MDMDRKGCTLEKVASLVLSSLGLGKDLLALFCLAFFTFFYFLSGITLPPLTIGIHDIVSPLDTGLSILFMEDTNATTRGAFKLPFGRTNIS